MFNPRDASAKILVPYDLSKARDRKNVHVAVELPNGKEADVEVPWWVISPEQEEAKKKILQNQFFLIRQGSLGEVLRCRRCKGKHRHFTDMCIELPFSGLMNGLHAYWFHAGKYGAENFLTEVELERYQSIQAVLSKSLPDFAVSHPETARQMKTDERDFDAGTVALGLLEPITRQKASALVWNINAHGRKPPLVLPGLET